MFKKIQSMLIVCVLIIGILPSLALEAKAADKFTSDGFSYALTGEGREVIILGYNDGISLTPNIPSEIEGKPVVGIGSKAFFKSKITQITIPNSVTVIGAAAFAYTTELSTVKIPNSVESIGTGAFENATGIKTIEMPNSITVIKDATFKGARELTNIEIPNSVVSIGLSAFSGVRGLTTLKIPNSVTSIDERAFSGATGLKSIEISNSVTRIEKLTFSGATGLTSIKIPNSVTRIGLSAFKGATGLTHVEIPNSVTIIKDAAFQGTTSLKSIEIPNSITSIESYTFKGATALTNIKFPNSLESIGTGAFEEATALTSITFPTSLEGIGDSAFKGATALTSVEIPNSVMGIGRYAFYGATSLNSIKFNNSSTRLGERVFNDVPYGLKVIGFKNSDVENYVKSENEEFPGRYDFVTSKHTIQFKGNQGKTIPTVLIDNAMLLKQPALPKKTNYLFEGWYTNSKYKTKWDFKNPIQQSMTLYAKWSPTMEKLTNISNKTVQVKGTTSPKSTIRIVQKGKEIAKGKSDAKGKFAIKIPKVKAKSIVEIQVKDAYGNKKNFKKTVADKIAPKVTVVAISNKQQTITGKTEAKAKVKIYVSNKYVKTVTANSKGKYSYKVGKKKAGTSIKVIAADQAGNKTTKIVKVVDKIAPGKPSVKSVKASSTTVVGKAEAGSTVYVYKGKTYLGKAKASSKGNYKVKIKKQKKGTTLLVKARDKAKNASKNMSIKVK